MKKILISILSVALILPIIVLAQGTPPPLPLLVYGDVTLYGSPAPIGTIVLIEKDNAEIVKITLTTAGKYSAQISSSYSGSTLSYKVNGNLVTEKIAANPITTASDKIDLSFGSAPSGGGGGIYSSSTPSPSLSASPIVIPLSTEAKKADTNNDNKIDVLDFNSLMVNWGSSGGVADFDGDGQIDVFDFNYLMIYWSV